jgi:hypothetical protein
MTQLFAVLLTLASAARALEPGQPVTITAPDGSVISGVVVSSGAPLSSQMGFNTAPPQTATYIGVPVIPVRPPTPQDQERFLKRQEAEREARKHQVTTPTSDWQFNLQQALDRQARGLPFSAP